MATPVPAAADCEQEARRPVDGPRGISDSERYCRCRQGREGVGRKDTEAKDWHQPAGGQREAERQKAPRHDAVSHRPSQAIPPEMKGIAAMPVTIQTARLPAQDSHLTH